MEDVKVSLADLPGTIKAFVISHADQTYTIVLNSRHTHEQNLISYAHELEHIRNGDYEKKCSADMIEMFAHKI